MAAPDVQHLGRPQVTHEAKQDRRRLVALATRQKPVADCRPDAEGHRVAAPARAQAAPALHCSPRSWERKLANLPKLRED
eukprot:3155083-Pyramimonas_sp.AAC.1